MADELSRLLAAAVQLTGDADKGRQLIEQPLPTFGGRTLFDLAHSGRVDDAVAYIESIAQGFVG